MVSVIYSENGDKWFVAAFPEEYNASILRVYDGGRTSLETFVTNCKKARCHKPADHKSSLYRR
jgi:hypothetical protein